MTSRVSASCGRSDGRDLARWRVALASVLQGVVSSHFAGRFRFSEHFSAGMERKAAQGMCGSMHISLCNCSGMERSDMRMSLVLCYRQGREWRARAKASSAGEYTNRNGNHASTTNSLSGISCRCKLRVESGGFYIRERPAVGRASGRAAFRTPSQTREQALRPAQSLYCGSK